jgi:hypothetical protein
MKKQNEKPTAQTATEKSKYELVEETFDDLSPESFENSNLGDYDQVFFVKPKTKDCAYFEFSKKTGNVIAKDPRTTIQTIDGEVSKIELGSYTYEKKEVKTFKIYLSKVLNEKKVLFILSSSYTQCGRSIINSLLGCKEPIERMTIALYVNASGFTSVKTLINGKKSDWKFKIEEQKQHIEEIKNKKGGITLRDYTELDELFETELQNHLSILLPAQQHRIITPEIPVEDVLNTETFGEDDEAGDFFEISDTDDK